MFNILVVEDDAKLNRLFCTVLEKKGYQPVAAFNGEQALNLMNTHYIDLLITDVMMPEMDGFELVRLLRQSGYQLPVLVITAKEQFKDKQTGFTIGVDDYMVKPIDVNEMILRVGALLRRAQIVSERRIVIGQTTLDYDSYTVSIGARDMILPQKEFQLLYKLASYPDKIFTRRQLMDEIWGPDSDTDERTVDVHINRVRERIRGSRDFKIQTVHGLGYKVVKSDEA